MKIILITSPAPVSEETETVEAVFGEGLDLLHIRKPGWKSDEIEKYLETLPEEWLAKAALHGHPDLANRFNAGGIHLSSRDSLKMLNGWRGKKSRSAHSFEEIEDQKQLFDYFFLSPVFNSISKEGYKSRFEPDDLKKFLSKARRCEIFALGGIEEQNLERAMAAGFDGVALLGTIWQHNEKKDRIKVFKKLLKRCREIAGTY